MSFFDFNSPSYGARLLQQERTRMMMEMTIRNPLAQAKVTGVPDAPRKPSFGGLRVIESGLVPDGAVYMMDSDAVIVPRYNRYGDRTGIYAFKKTPLWTRHTLGAQEAARARRRAQRGRRA
jgi:hypothetical protein